MLSSGRGRAVSQTDDPASFCNLDNWALFEPFDLETAGDAEAIRIENPDFLEACKTLGIVIDP